jgi:hypothetical protein
MYVFVLSRELKFNSYECGLWENVSCWLVDCVWNVMAHGDAREGKWRGCWRMEWVASTLHTTSEHGVSSITTADAHTSVATTEVKWTDGHVRRAFKSNRDF